MILSDTAEYALRAVLYIAQHDDDGRPVRTEDVANALHVPRNYLSKILHVLARRGLLTSSRGPLGGFRLARNADRLELYRIIEPFDPIGPRRECLLGRPNCNDNNPCPAHERWKGISDAVTNLFRRTTVGDLLREGGTLT